ncbi:DoxX family protein [Methylibium sp.]|uniref:DoxX family protein n=1 Tax=Methylibium sp. TaxID=2067992 RepID=UPI003D14A86C
MNNQRSDIAALILRITLGTALIAHGLLKFLVFTLPGAAAFFTSVGFPGWAAYVVAPLEVVTGVAVLVGFNVTIAALIALPVLLGALVVHSGNGWLFINPNGGWEYPAVLALLAVGVALLGDGAYSLRRTTKP